MAEAVVSVALGTLRDLLLEEVKFLSGARSEVEALEAQLKELQCLLEDVDKRQHESSVVRNWISQIRKLVYRAEDVVETYAVDVSSKRRQRGFVKKLLRKFACALNEGFTLHHIRTQILDINSKIARVTKNMQEYGIANIIHGGESSYVTAEEKRRLQRQTYPFEIEDCFVGMEEDLKKLVSLVIADDDDEQHKVVSIWGMGGIGKTTIARKVYNHDEIRRSFGSFAWVCITQECQIRSVYEEVFQQLIPHRTEEIARLGIRGLIEQIREVQKDKRCMIVLDDLWKMGDWETLTHAFLIPGANSKVLITTRKENIAKVGFSYELGLLNEDDGWNLLKNKAFPRNNASIDFGVAEKEFLEKIGREMVHKCGYLPLVISLLGGVLKSAKSLKEWESVNKNIDKHLYKREEGVGEENKVDGVLDLSYEDLPYYLKQCFLYMGCFKEDAKIYVDELYILWIAQGMVSDQAGRREDETLSDIVELYLSELASRSIVQVQVSTISGRKYETCQLHDVVRELCLSKGEKEDFHLKVVNHQGGKFSISDPSLSGSETRHLAIHIRGNTEFTIADHNEEEEVTDKTRVRSLQLLNVDGYQMECNVDFPGKNTVDFQKLKLLRVLKFVRCSFERRKLPKEIGDLIHLRYLGFRSCGGLDELPSSISNLTYLYCLDLNLSQDIRIPNVLKKMFRLKHLFLPYYSEEKIGNYRLSLEGLDLETLDGFNSLVHDFKSLSMMKNLQYLTAEVHDNESMSSIIDNINSAKWHNLRYSSLYIKKGCEFTSSSSEEVEGSVVLKKVLTSPNLNTLMIDDVPMRKLISDFQTITPQLILPNLVSLYLWRCEIEDDPMEMLEKLPSLENLYLCERSYVGEEMICHAKGFPRLKVLQLGVLLNLREWRVEQGAFPILSDITIGSCPQLEMVPDGLRFITTLKKLGIGGMPELGKRVSKWRKDEQREGEDFDKVRHVPSIFIYNW